MSDDESRWIVWREYLVQNRSIQFDDLTNCFKFGQWDCHSPNNNHLLIKQTGNWFVNFLFVNLTKSINLFHQWYLAD